MEKDTSCRFSKCVFVEQIFNGKTFHLSRQSSRFEDYGQLTRERARIPHARFYEMSRSMSHINGRLH